MNRRKILLFFVFFLVLPSAVLARNKHSSRPAASSAPSHEYVSALNTADRFLHAWQSEDHEAGLLLLSDAGKKQSSEARLQAFFSPDSSSQRSFQIAHGKKLHEGRYSFQVTLLDESGKKARVRSSELIVARRDSDDWLVDKLP